MTPTKAQLEQALKIAEKIEALEAELAAIFSGEAQPKRRGRGPGKKNKTGVETPADERNDVEDPDKKTRKKAKRNMSPEARERIAEAQRKRWAKSK